MLRSSLLPLASADNEYGRRGRGWGWKGWNRVMRGEEEGPTLLLRRRCCNPPLYPSLPSLPFPLLSIPIWSPPTLIYSPFLLLLLSGIPRRLSTFVWHPLSPPPPFLTSNRGGIILLPSYPLCHGGIRRSLPCQR